MFFSVLYLERSPPSLWDRSGVKTFSSKTYAPRGANSKDITEEAMACDFRPHFPRTVNGRTNAFQAVALSGDANTATTGSSHFSPRRKSNSPLSLPCHLSSRRMYWGDVFGKNLPSEKSRTTFTFVWIFFAYHVSCRRQTNI